MLDEVGAYCPGISTIAAPPPTWPPSPSEFAAIKTACELDLAAMAGADDFFGLNRSFSSAFWAESCFKLDAVSDFDSHDPAQRSGACDAHQDRDAESAQGW